MLTPLVSYFHFISIPFCSKVVLSNYTQVSLKSRKSYMIGQGSKQIIHIFALNFSSQSIPRYITILSLNRFVSCLLATRNVPKKEYT